MTTRSVIKTASLASEFSRKRWLFRTPGLPQISEQLAQQAAILPSSVVADLELARKQILDNFKDLSALTRTAEHQREMHAQILKIAQGGISAHLIGQQQEHIRQHLLAAIGQSWAVPNWKPILPPGLAEEMAAWSRSTLARALTDVAIAETDDPDGAEAVRIEAWAAISTQREAIATCLRRIAEIAQIGSMTGAPIPQLVFVLLLVLALLGEVANEILSEREDRNSAD